MLKLRSHQPVQPALGQSTISANIVPFVLGMVTWAVFGDVLKGIGGVGEAAALKGTSAVSRKISGR